MTAQVLNFFFRDENVILIYPMIGLFITAVAHLGALLLCLKDKQRHSHDFGFLGGCAFALVLCSCMVSGHPGMQRGMLVLFGLLLFSTICAILEYKVSSQKTWGQLWGDSMRTVIDNLDNLKKLLILGSEFWGRVKPWIKLLLLIGVLILIPIWMRLSPESIIILAVICGLGFFFVALYKCLHSCRKLLRFWFCHSFVAAIVLYEVVRQMLPRGVTSDPILYIALCLFLTVFWGMGAGVADYDVAQMAGKIINTITTLTIAIVNVFVWWARNEAILPELASNDDFIYCVNFALLPIIVAGYLAMLFIDGINYYKKKTSRPGKCD